MGYRGIKQTLHWINVQNCPGRQDHITVMYDEAADGAISEERRISFEYRSMPEFEDDYIPMEYRETPVYAPLAQTNFMGGISYTLGALETLKMISASSIFGEAQYYRDSAKNQAAIYKNLYELDGVFARYALNALDPFLGLTTEKVMEKAIDNALNEDFEGTLHWAIELRERYLMRLNPQVILVRAAMHPAREAYTRSHPGKFAEILDRVMRRGDDVISQIEYSISVNGSKKGIPAILKKSWAKNIGSMNRYTMAKYKSSGMGLIDAVRISHAKGELVDELMRTGTVNMPENESVWERLRASGKTWEEILGMIRMPHMALLRNLRGIFSETDSYEIRKKALVDLTAGVKTGKQFPFRYLSAWKAIEETGCGWVTDVQEALEKCIDVSLDNLPKLPGRNAFLTDNSGSAWGACTSEWGTMRVAEIGNLSSVIGAMKSDEAFVFPFGDKLLPVRIHKDEGVLRQASTVNSVGKDCGKATENGIWLFFRDAINKQEHWDNIFVYSDMQAGHGGLYGIRKEDYAAIDCCVNGNCIDVNRLVEIYREKVNPNVNVYMIQTAGYTNALVPEYGYRTSILYGWTGKELIYADAMRRTWDEIESKR
ncbi:MAG: TROVE domain-containing protein [Clostridia bacterium]|nr:TROVE domain-containing protein [Clostridia bacterium]